jgi:hypothetical protein
MPRRPVVDRFGDDIPQRDIKNGTAFVPICGPIIKGATGSDKWAFGVCSPDDIAEDLDWALGEKAQSIVLPANWEPRSSRSTARCR